MQKKIRPLKAQGGYSIVAVLLGVLAASAVTAVGLQQAIHKKNLDMGEREALHLKPIAAAANEYIAENYNELSAGKTITLRGVTVASPMEPTLDDLISLRYLPQGYENAARRSQVTLKLKHAPDGCVVPDCEVQGYLVASSPFVRKATELNSVALGSYQRVIGPDALVSTNIDQARLISANGLSFDNPLASKPIGAYGVAIGWGTGQFRDFLTLNDSRNPNFRGDLSVKGQIKSEELLRAPIVIADESLGAGTGNSVDGNECRLGEILNSGQIISRSANCISRVVINPTDSSISANRLNGSASVKINGENSTVELNNNQNNKTIEMNGADTSIIVRSNDLSKKIIINGDSGLIKTSNANGSGVSLSSSDGISLSTDSVENIGNFKTDGQGSRLTTTLTQLTGLFGVGTNCGSYIEGDVAREVNNRGLIMCMNSKWKLISIENVVKNDNCSVEGATAKNENGISLICSGGKWVNLTDRLGRSILFGSYMASNGSLIPKPSCLSGVVSQSIYLQPQTIDTNNNRANYLATDAGVNWRVNITDGTGAQIAGSAIATVYCIYGDI